MRRHAKALSAVVVAMLVLGVTTAFAIDTHAPGALFDGSGTPNGFVSLAGVAVDQSGGDVYAVDASGAPDFSGSIDRFDSAGAFQNQIAGAFSNPQDVAVDSSGGGSDGNVYLTDTGNNLVYAFDSSGAAIASFGAAGQINGSDDGIADPDATPANSLSNPCGLAVDQSNGNLFAADQFNNRVWIFDSSGRYLARVFDSSVNGPCGLALTSTGDLYVRNANDGKVLRFNKTGATTYEFASILYDASEGGTTDVATNPADNHVYVNRGDRIVEYDSGGSQVSSFGQGVLSGGSAGVAVDATSGTVYASDGATLRTFGPLITTNPPVPTIDPVDSSGVTANEAHLTGTVDPQGFDANWRFEYSTDHTNWTAVNADQGPLSGTGAQAVSDDANGLQPNKDYFARLIASNGLDDPVVSSEESFTTDAAAPEVTTGSATLNGETSGKLSGTVNPNNLSTTYHFEYGTDTSYGTSAPIPDASAGSGGSPVPARTLIDALSPETTYHYRLVATNAQGTTEGSDQTITVPPIFVPGPPGADARHYEKVSPADKGNGDIVGDGGTNIASRSGDAVTLATRTPFGDTIGSGVSGQTQYVVRRTAQGWLAHAIPPQPRADEYQTFFGATRYQAFSEDLSAAVLMAYDLPAASGDVPLRSNLYAQDTGTRAVRPVTMAQNGFPNPLPHPTFEMADNFNWGVSADARHIAFVSLVPYLPRAVTSGTFFGPPNVYQWDDGVLSLAGILPDGSVPAGGSDAAIPTNPRYRAAMSADGTRLLFTASPGSEPQLYQRVGGSRTVWISEPEFDTDPRVPLPPGAQSEPSGVGLGAATPDGRSVFFVTSSPLLTDDDNVGQDLYRWTADAVAGHHLTRITNGFEGVVIGLSDDGERVYFQTQSAQIVVWDHGRATVITSSVPIPGSNVALSVDASPGLARVSPDGRYLAFITDFSDFGVGLTGEVTNAHYEMYHYTLGDRLRCISCPSAPARADATILPEATSGIIVYLFPGIRPRFLSDTGRAFFSTAEALVDEDINGVADTYEYDPATANLRLISTGTGSDPATFSEASASGNDVFLVTRQRLVAGDQDGLVDLYDARIGDALPDASEAPTTPACEGESCQPPPAVGPAEDLLGTTLSGTGNARTSRRVRCNKNQRKIRRNGKARCVRKHSKRANNNRRAGQ